MKLLDSQWLINFFRKISEEINVKTFLIYGDLLLLKLTKIYTE